MARWPLHNDAHEARPRKETPAGSAGAALAGVGRLRPFGAWLLATFTLDRWLVASVATIAIVAAGVVSTSFLGSEPREGLTLPPLRAPQDVTLVEAQPPGEPEPSVASEPAVAPATSPALAMENRADCEAIRGTPYLSDVERFWFVATCVEHEPVFVSATGVGETNTAAVTGPVAPEAVTEPEAPEVVAPPVETSPPVAPGYTGGDAAYVVYGWLVYQGYVPVDGSCRGSGSGNDWTVTCLVEPTEPCTGSGCVTFVQACLIPEPRTVWFC